MSGLYSLRGVNMACACALSLLAACALVAHAQDSGAGPGVDVEVVQEGTVYTHVPADNGSGPFWSYGCTTIARLGETVIVSEMETGKDVPLLCNTRWRLRKKTGNEWQVVDEAEGYRQREPALLGTTSDEVFFLNVNDSTQPPGAMYKECVPHLLKYRLVDVPAKEKIMPSWEGETNFTDHSYRGFCVDRGTKELLMLNINATTSAEHWCHMSESGEVLGKGIIEFPIRSCYIQAALRNRAAHVLAIGDIVEPVEEWRNYKFEQTQRKWDYVFRILHFTWTPDITTQGFSNAIEIANVDRTAGQISNQDLWIGPDGDAYIMYTERLVQNAIMRDKFFPDLPLWSTLHLAVVKDGTVVSRRVLVQGSDECDAGTARFHETPDGKVYAVVYNSGSKPGNFLCQVHPATDQARLIPIPLAQPMGVFLLASVRAGNAPSNTIDMLGAGPNNTICHAEIVIK